MLRPPTAVAAMGLLLLIGMVSSGLGAALPLLRPALDAPSGSGSLVSLYSLGGLVAVVAIRVLPARSGRLGVGVLIGCFALGCAGMGLSQTWLALNLLAIVAGLGFGGLIVYVNAAFAVGFGPRSAAMLGFVNAAFALGTILGPLAVGLLSAHGVQVGLVLIGGLTLLTLPASACGTVSTGNAGNAGSAGSTGSTEPPRQSWGTLRVLAPLLAVAFTYAALETGTGAWMATQLTADGMSEATAAGLTTAFWGALFGGRLLLTPLAARLGPGRLLTHCVAAAVVAFLLACIGPLAPIAYPLAGFAIAPVFPVMLLWGAQLTGSARDATSATLLAGMAGNAVFPVGIGWVSGGDPLGIPVTLAASAVLCLAAALATLRLRAGRSAPERVG